MRNASIGEGKLKSGIALDAHTTRLVRSLRRLSVSLGLQRGGCFSWWLV